MENTSMFKALLTRITATQKSITLNASKYWLAALTTCNPNTENIERKQINQLERDIAKQEQDIQTQLEKTVPELYQLAKKIRGITEPTDNQRKIAQATFYLTVLKEIEKAGNAQEYGFRCIMEELLRNQRNQSMLHTKKGVTTLKENNENTRSQLPTPFRQKLT